MHIALLQSFLIWGKPEENLNNFDYKLADIEGCDIILLPEMFTSGSMMVKREPGKVKAELEIAARWYEKVRQKMTEWAARQKAVVIGSTVCREEGNYYNRLIVAFPDGKSESYDKRHCFRMGGEQEYFTPGNSRLIVDYKGVKIAAFICYDLRFPVWSRNVENYDLAVYIANWPASRREVWQTLLRARAIENQCYVAGVNCVGKDNNGLVYSGDSMLVDARGQVMVQGEEGREVVVRAKLDAEQLHGFRKRFPVLEDRDSFRLDIDTGV